MIIFLYGSDSYRLKRASDEIIARYKVKYTSGVNLFRFDFSKPDSLNLCEDALRTASFFNEHKLVVCKNIFSTKSLVETASELINKYSISVESGITLLATENQPEKDLVTNHIKLFGILSDKKNVVKAVEHLNGQELQSWIKKEFQIRDCSIRADAIRKLIGLIGNDSWRLINEIDKLSAYKMGEVTAGDIDLLVSSTTDLNIFNLVDAIGSKNRHKATGLLYQELKTGRDPYYLLSMFAYHFKNLLYVFENPVPKHLHPFVAKKAASQVHKFSKEDLLAKFGYFAGLDIASKNGQVNLEDALYNFVDS